MCYSVCAKWWFTTFQSGRPFQFAMSPQRICRNKSPAQLQADSMTCVVATVKWISTFSTVFYFWLQNVNNKLHKNVAVKLNQTKRTTSAGNGNDVSDQERISVNEKYGTNKSKSYQEMPLFMPVDGAVWVQLPLWKPWNNDMEFLVSHTK